MVWKMLKSREAMLATLKTSLEAREKQLLARGVAKERLSYDPTIRHLTAEVRKIRRAIAAHANIQLSAAERAERAPKRDEAKAAKPGKEAKAAKAAEADA